MVQQAAGLKFGYTLYNRLRDFHAYKVTANGFLVEGDLYHIHGPEGEYWQHSAPPDERPNLPRYTTSDEAARVMLARHRQHAMAFLAATNTAEEPA